MIIAIDFDGTIVQDAYPAIVSDECCQREMILRCHASLKNVFSGETYFQAQAKSNEKIHYPELLAGNCASNAHIGKAASPPQPRTQAAAAAAVDTRPVTV